MSICTGAYYRFPFVPRRIRSTTCEAFAQQDRWIGFVYAMDLTPSPADNDVASGGGAWSVVDLPVSIAMQDVDDRGDDLLFVGIANRLYILDWDRFYDEFGWECHTPIYRRLVFGPIPSTAEASDSPAGYDPFQVKHFRRFTFELNDIPTAPASKYRASVEEEGRPSTRRMGVRSTFKRCDAQISARGLAFLVTIEHQAEEQFAPLWWRAEWDIRGPRIRTNPHTSA